MDYNETDLFLAKELQAAFDADLRLQQKTNDAKKTKKDLVRKKNAIQPEQEKLSISLNDPSWELLDPNPDIYSLFQIFNKQFFWGELASVVVTWSKNMTMCAGVCSYEGRAGMCSVRLSAPLLKLRPRKDLVDTLLHEMIHAFLFVTHNNRDRTGHGPNFHEHMHRINRIAGTSITVYHTFHNEVALYQQHIWKCDGPCQHRHPYYGLIKRSRNRAPNKHDPWWAEHHSRCGGTFVKIQEPENFKTKKRKADTNSETSSSKGDIRKFLKKNDNISKGDSSCTIGAISNPGNVSVSSVTVNGATSANVHKINTSTGSSKPYNGSGKSSTGSGGQIMPGRYGTLSKKSSSSVVTVRNPKAGSSSLNTKGHGLSNDATSTSVGTEEVSKSTNHVATFIAFSGCGKMLDKAPRDIAQSANNSGTCSSPVKLDNNANHSVIIIDDDDDDSWISMVKEPTEEELLLIESKSLFPCPFCQRKFTSADINRHAETHL